MGTEGASYLLYVHHHKALYFGVFFFVKSAVCEGLRLWFDSIRHAGWSTPGRGATAGFLTCVVGIL